MDKATIFSAFKKFKTDKAIHRYEQMYADIFSKVTPSRLLEIGVNRGKSLAAWAELFPEAKVIGMDKRVIIKIAEAEDIEVVYADSSKPNASSLIGEKCDIIIDDGDHRPDVQWQTFLNFKDSWTKYYVIEDICTIENEKLLRRRFNSNGFYNVKTYKSAFKGDVSVNGIVAEREFYAMVGTKV